MAATLRDLVRRTALWAAAAALVIALALGLVAAEGARRVLERLADQRGTDIATRAALSVNEFARERHREIDRIAADPAVIAAAQAAARSVAARGLDRQPPATLERMLAGTRRLGGDADLARYLKLYPIQSEFTEIVVSERHGIAVEASGVPDAAWRGADSVWRKALAEGAAEGDPVIDSSLGSVTVRYASAIRPAEGARATGVVEGVYQLDRLGFVLSAGDLADSAYLQLVDRRGDLLYGPDESALRAVPQAAGLYNPDAPARAVVTGPNGPELVVAVPAPRGKLPANQAYYWVLYHQPTAVAYATARTVQHAVWLTIAVLFVLGALGLWALAGWLQRRVAAPVRAASGVAARVATGDLTVSAGGSRADAAEIRELVGSVQTMVGSLRQLVGSIRAAADEAAAMAQEISASTEEMSAATEEMSATTQDLSKRAAEQAQLVRQAADDAAKILDIATTLAGGADEAARRNTELSTLAQRHKETLDRSTAQLALLAQETEKGAQEAEALVQASAEIQRFVTQAKTVATQTNTLALNAAIEAARAGPQGRGFAVVADEVRKLASQAAAAAGETADTVRGVLARVQATRERLFALSRGGVAAREAAESAAAGLARVAADADANDAWTREIAAAAAEAKRLVEEIATRLSSVAAGTENLLAAAQEIAASSEEQNASTQEIASSANQLATAAESLTGAVKSFRLAAD